MTQGRAGAEIQAGLTFSRACAALGPAGFETLLVRLGIDDEWFRSPWGAAGRAYGLQADRLRRGRVCFCRTQRPVVLIGNHFEVLLHEMRSSSAAVWRSYVMGHRSAMPIDGQFIYSLRQIVDHIPLSQPRRGGEQGAHA